MKSDRLPCEIGNRATTHDRDVLRRLQTVLDDTPGFPNKVEVRECVSHVQGSLFGQAERGRRMDTRPRDERRKDEAA